MRTVKAAGLEKRRDVVVEISINVEEVDSSLQLFVKVHIVVSKSWHRILDLGWQAINPIDQKGVLPHSASNLLFPSGVK